MNPLPLHVLLIEDNPADARVIEAMLEATSRLVVLTKVATTLQAQMLIAMGAKDGSIDVVLLDLGLQGSLPESTVQWMRTQAAIVPIVVISAVADEHLAISAVRDGAQDHLVKGRIDAELLMRTIEHSIERRRSQAALHSSEERCRRIVETAQEGIWMLGVDGRTELVNPRMAAILGLDPVAMIGLSLDQLAVSAAEARAVEAAERDAGDRPAQYETRLRRADGSEVLTSISSSRLVDADGRCEGTLRMVEDITSTRAAQQTLRETEDQLRQIQKLESIGLLAGGIAHDFNNLLTAIRGYVSLARSTLDEGHPAVESLSQVEEAARQATGVANSLLTFAKKKRTDKAPIRLAAIVEEACRLLRRTMGVRITLNVDVAQASSLWVSGDETQLHQVVTNLALNARDAVSEGGVITVSLEPTPSPVKKPSTPGSWIMLRVNDNGVGMTPELVSRIFEPFFTTKSRGVGTGLGLPVLHGIVQDHGGEIEVESTPNQGSTFRVYLPCIPAPHAATPSGAAAKSKRRQPAGPVLIVQNSPLVRGVVASMLATFDYEVIHAGNIAEALAKTGSMSRGPGLMVADLSLQDGRATDLFETLSRRSPEIRGIVIADLVMDEPIQHQGLVKLRKPFRVADLEQSLETLAGPADGRTR